MKKPLWSWLSATWMVGLSAGSAISGQKKSVQVALNQLQSGFFKDYSLVLAGTTLATLPLLVLFVLTGRQLVAGIMQGAVKG